MFEKFEKNGRQFSKISQGDEDVVCAMTRKYRDNFTGWDENAREINSFPTQSSLLRRLPAKNEIILLRSVF